MEEILNKYIVPSGVLLTFIATTINIYFTRKNLKTTKYIDTITSERIKWLSHIREEVTLIISIISETLILHNQIIEDIESQNPNEKYENSESYEYQKHYFDSPSKNVLIINERINYQEIIKKLYLLKLRFNVLEDLEILKLIESFIDFYSQKYVSKKYVSKKDVEEMHKNIECFTSETQILLKKEWEKVKTEAKGK